MRFVPPHPVIGAFFHARLRRTEERARRGLCLRHGAGVARRGTLREVMSAGVLLARAEPTPTPAVASRAGVVSALGAIALALGSVALGLATLTGCAGAVPERQHGTWGGVGGESWASVLPTPEVLAAGAKTGPEANRNAEVLAARPADALALHMYPPDAAPSLWAPRRVYISRQSESFLFFGERRVRERLDWYRGR